MVKKTISKEEIRLVTLIIKLHKQQMKLIDEINKLRRERIPTLEENNKLQAKVKKLEAALDLIWKKDKPED